MNLNYKYIYTLFLFLICACTPKNTEQTLRVGMELAYPPFETKNLEGNPIGISVDIAEALGQYLKRPVHIENISWDGLIPSLQTGKVDIVISSLTITEERRKQVDFSDPYASSYLALLVNKNSSVNSLEELNKKNNILAVKKGTTAFIFAQKYLTNLQLNAFTSESAAVMEVIQNKADAFMYDQLTIYRQNKNNPTTTRIIRISPQETPEQWGIAVKKGNTELLTNINNFLQEFKAEKGFEKITEKYLSEEKNIFDQHNFSFFF